MVADLTGFNVHYLVFYMVKIWLKSSIDFFALINYNLPTDYT